MNRHTHGTTTIRSWWHHLKQANDTIASARSIFIENHDYKSFFHVRVNMYVPIFRGLDVRGGRKLRTDTHTGQLQ